MSSLSVPVHNNHSLPAWPDVCPEYRPFMSTGSVSLRAKGKQYTYPIHILRDTGASCTMLLKSIIAPDVMQEQDTSRTVEVKGIEGKGMKLPLIAIEFRSGLVTGPVQVALVDHLPVEGVHMLLGNDIAEGKVAPEPIMVESPTMFDNTAQLSREFPSLFPECAVTRAQARLKSKQSIDSWNDSVIDLSQTLLKHENGANEQFSLEAVPDKFISAERIAELQQSDPTLTNAFEKLQSKYCKSKTSRYILQNGLLLREYHSPCAPADAEWGIKKQIVVPHSLRNTVLSLAHTAPMGGHLGINKTYHKILNHFYWPSLRADCKSYCSQCETCQLIGKAQHTPAKAPLIPIPAFDEPFKNLIIDCVGPLPKSRSGKQYLLTIMCTSTRYPDAIPLGNIKTPAICNALKLFFSHYGLPSSIQSDQGTNFQSKVFKQFLSEQGILQRKSSAYHPESQGALERFHQTFKTMLRAYCVDHGPDWDVGVPLLLFSIRDSPQESLGFSPFELVYGHQVRGPLSLLSEQWIEPNQPTNLLNYVIDFKTKLYETQTLAQENLKDSQFHMKTWYDRKARIRHFNEGDEVLVLLPMSGNPLQAKYSGPYKIVKRLNDVDYVIKTPDRRKGEQVCHINMLKAFQRPTATKTNMTAAPHSTPPPHSEPSDFELPEIGPVLHNSQVLANLREEKLAHLELPQQQDLSSLLLSFPSLFSDVPRRTNAAYHDIELIEDTPVKQHPYRMNTAKQKAAETEIQYMLDNNIIERAYSEWSSPCLLVPKPDNSYRFVTDFRKLNKQTKTDSYPLPRLDDCIDQIGHSKFVSKVDLLKGYWQVPLTPRAKLLSTFTTSQGLFSYNVLPFGLKNAPPTFQRMMNQVVSGLSNTAVYIDDVVVHSDTWIDHIKHLKALLDRLNKANLTINLAKSSFGKATVNFLGHIVGQGKVCPLESKVQAVKEFPPPKDKRSLMRFLGMAGFYRKFCKNFSVITAPLTDLLKKDHSYNWTKSCEEAFDKIKSLLISQPVLAAPSFDRPFKLAIDASDAGIGAVLLQEGHDGMDHPVSYFSKKFTRYQAKYSTIEKEALALLLALQHFEVYLGGSNEPVIVYTDHNPLTFILKMKHKNQRLLRWFLIMQEFSLDIRHIKGVKNVLADTLSRAPLS